MASLVRRPVGRKIRRCCRGPDQGRLKSAAKYLNQTGLKPRRAKAFTRQTVMQTLTSEASFTIFEPVDRVRIKEALQPKEERKYHGRNATRLLAGGILRCGACDRPMYIGTRAVRRKDPDAEPIKHYRCRSALDGYPCDAKVSASARLVEAAVEEEFLSGWGRMEMTEVVSPAHHQRLALLTEQIDELSATLVKARGFERRKIVEQLEAQYAELEQQTPPTLSRTDRSADVRRVLPAAGPRRASQAAEASCRQPSPRTGDSAARTALRHRAHS
jgi:site-specific DNA recombinase